MLDMPTHELVLFCAVLCVYLLAGVVGVRQVIRRDSWCRPAIAALVALGVSLESLLLVLRAVAIQAIPLTGLFDSMVLLTLVFGIAYLFLSLMVSQAWFGAILSWLLAGMTLLAAAVAEPATEPHGAVQTPWAAAHAVAMVLGGAAVVLATASAILYLLASRRLKQKRLASILGRIPSLDRLERLNLASLQATFLLLGFGLISGFGLASVRAAMLEMELADWFTDAKVIVILAGWLLIGLVLALRKFAGLPQRTIAYLTMLTVFLILFGIVGTTIFCGTLHDFSALSAAVSHVGGGTLP